MDKQDTEKKLARYLDFLKQDESNVSLLNKIADCYTALGEPLKAKPYGQLAKSILNTAPKESKGYTYQQALEDYAEGRITQMMIQLQTLLELNPFFEAEVLFARGLHCQGKYTEALEKLSQIGEKYGHHPDTYAALALLYYDSGQLDKASAFAQLALDEDPSHYDARVVKLLLNLTNTKKDPNEITALLSLQAKDSRVWFASGVTELQAFKLLSAEKAFLKAIELAPGFYEAWFSLAWCQLLQDKLPDAKNSFAQLKLLSPQQSSGSGGVALIHALLGEDIEAQKNLDEASLLDSKCFLVGLAQLMLTKEQSPLQAKQQFDILFSSSAKQLNLAMSTVLSEIGKQQGTLH